MLLIVMCIHIDQISKKAVTISCHDLWLACYQTYISMNA